MPEFQKPLQCVLSDALIKAQQWSWPEDLVNEYRKDLELFKDLNKKQNRLRGEGSV